MSTIVKKKERLQKRLGQLRLAHGRGQCWVCSSGSGVKTAREGYGTRCSRCIRLGKTNVAVTEYEALKLELEALGKRK